MSNATRRRLAAFSWIAVAALAAVPPALAASTESCVSAEVEAPFRLPDGVVHPAGALTICSIREFSPVASLHRLSVDGRPAGVFLSHKRIAEGTGASAPELVFAREGVLNLRLLGYNVSSHGKSVAYRVPASTPPPDALARAW